MSINNARKNHVTPGVYTTETEITYSSNSIGITSLGVVGETLKGPAFQPIFINDWETFTDYFGGTNTEHFKGSGYPKYELPYIAQNYLKDSNQLYVTRVLGLSGYNAGPAWVIKTTGGGRGQDMVVAIIRSRGNYVRTLGTQKESTEEVTSGQIEAGFRYIVRSTDGKTASVTYNSQTIQKDGKFIGVEGETTFTATSNAKVYGDCGVVYDYDKLLYTVDPSYTADSFLRIKPAYTEAVNFSCNNINKKYENQANQSIPCSSADYGTFILEGKTIGGTDFSYTVSFNPNRKDYIYNVIGQNPDDNSAPIYIEELYDIALEQLILNNIVGAEDYINGIFYDESYDGTQPNQNTNGMEYYDYNIIEPKYASVSSLLSTPNQVLNSSYLGQRFLFAKKYCTPTEYILETLDAEGKLISMVESVMDDSDDGKIFIVKRDRDASGRITYNYHYIIKGTEEEKLVVGGANDYVYVNDENLFYHNLTSIGVDRVTGDLNDYKEEYRYASTPWIVSEIKGNSAVNDVVKLFRFHSISDGNTANRLFKISIQNINPETLNFDVVIRRFNDDDGNVLPLETFVNCNLDPNSTNYIARKIGDFNEEYPINSNYVTVEMADDNDTGRYSFPCGFLGYPVRDLGRELKKPHLQYNINVDEELRNRRQYFGISNLVGVDDDMFSYKGKTAYSDGVLTDGFHLDSRVGTNNSLGNITTVDGENPTDSEGNYLYTWQSVSIDNIIEGENEAPKISNGEDILGTIYEDKDLRKFTVGLYGGFDGWDIYRKSRSNTDDFNILKYKGKINLTTGKGEHFDYVRDGAKYGLPGRAINSDYYAYLAGYMTFDNPTETNINLFASPGVDYVNNLMLVDEVIDMIEEDRKDVLYVVTTPDKPFGSNNKFTAEEAAQNMIRSELNSSYACTYYPWCRYNDQDNNKTIYLPVTRDIVRLIAITDNTSYSWFPPANQNGQINCINARTNLKLADTDTLYDSKINPILTYAQDGVYAWGIKNMLDGDSQLTRIGVRRMLIQMKTLISRASKQLIFTPNDATAKKTFIALVTPILDDIRANRGISDYRIKVEDSIEARERRELPAEIWIKPIGMLEYISLDFILTPEGAVWD